MSDYEPFRRCTFEADTPVGRVRVRAGRGASRLERLLEHRDARGWAFITAWNPDGELLEHGENRRRQEELEHELSNDDVAFFAGVAVPDVEGWLPEENVLVVGIDREEALDLAREYDQEVVLFGERGGPAKLIEAESGDDVTFEEGESDLAAPEESERELESIMPKEVESLGPSVDDFVDEVKNEPPPPVDDLVDWEVMEENADPDESDRSDE